MGRARPARARPGDRPPPAVDRDPSAIPSEAAARPDERRRAARCERWRWGGGRDAPAARSRAIAHAMAPPAFTGSWQELPPARAPADRRARAGARRSGRGGAGDRAGAARGAGGAGPDRRVGDAGPRRSPGGSRRICGAGAIEADDSAGRPLSRDAARHPAARARRTRRRSGSRRCRCWPCSSIRWCMARRRAARLARRRARARSGAARAAAGGGAGRHRRCISPPATGATADLRAAPLAWWREVAPLLRPLEAASPSGARASPACSPRSARRPHALAGDAAWAGPAGRAAAELFAELEAAAGEGPERVEPARAARPARAAARRRGGAAALRPASAPLHLGPDRGAAAARRSDDPRRAQRRRLAGAAARPIPGWRRGCAPSSACRRWSGGSALPRTISPPRSARRRCWSPAPGATPARRPSPRASGCGWRR